MQEKQEGVFRREAVERLSSPERLDQLIRIVSPKDWLLLGGALFVTCLALAWCIWGRLPTTVTGQGAIIHPRRVVEIQSPASGRLVEFKLRVGDLVQKADALGVIDQAEIRRQLQEDRSRLVELYAQDRVKSSIQQQQTLLQAREIEAQKSFLARQRLNREKSIADTEALAPILRKRLESRRTMMEQGLIPRVSDELLQAEKEDLENQARMSDLQAQLGEIESELKQLDTKEKDLARQLLEATTSRKNEILSLGRNIALAETQLLKNSSVVSDYSGRVLEVDANVGQVLSPGSRLAVIEVRESTGDLVCVTYFPVGDGKRIRTGMKIQVTPDTVRRERFGGILGTVKMVSAFPVTKEGAALILGNADLATRLLKDEPRIEVVTELQRDARSESGFKWSSSSGPHIAITAGTTTSGRVTVEERAPATYILPFLRAASGIY